MEATKEYERSLGKYNFKTILEFICFNQDIDNKPKTEAEIGNISIVTTDKHPLNRVTLLGVLSDAKKHSRNKDGRKTINTDEMTSLCRMRNKIYPIETSFKKGEGLGAIFYLSKQQSIFKYGESLLPCFQRDYYIFTEIDKIYEKNANRFLNANNFYSSLFKNDMVTGLAMIMLFFLDVYQNSTVKFGPKLTKYETFVLETFENYITYHHGIDEEYNPLKHCLVKVGKTYYIPFIGILFNRLSHILYWRLKDEFKNKRKDNFFPDSFGDYFEEYVDVFLKYALGEGKYTRIDKAVENGKGIKKPDFEFNKAGINFIVECKSRLISIEDAEVKLLSGSFRNKIIEGLSQLKEYKSTDVNSCRIIVLYEDDFPIIELFKKRIIDYLSFNGNYWIVTIDEFEAFIELDDESFQKVVKRMLKQAKTDNPISLGKAMSEVGVGKQYSSLYLEYIEKQINDKADEIVRCYDSL